MIANAFIYTLTSAVFITGYRIVIQPQLLGN